ncbi:RL31 protein, partial [Crocuta crocuta]
PFQWGPGRMAPTKKGGVKKGRSAINEVMSREHAITIHKRIHGGCFQKCVPRALTEMPTFAVKETATTPAVSVDTRLNQAIWAKGIRTVPSCIRVWWSRIQN